MDQSTVFASFQGFLNQLEGPLNQLSEWVWGMPLLVLLFGTHLFLTWRLRFMQRYIGTAIRISLERGKEGEGDVSQFGALTTALAATIGTGNIVGVSTAVASGGPGAVLWMWLTGVFGIATKYSEALLSVKYRITTENGQMAGGPMYVLERGLGQKWLGVIFAALTAVAAFGIGNMVQANSIATMVKETFNIPPVASGIVLAILTAVVILGGIKSIAGVCEKLVPFMAIFYVTGCVILLAIGWKTIPESILIILSSAFSGQAALGGFLGATVKETARFGIARGLFSNESGLGSAPIVAAAAQTRNPVRQALVSSTGTFWDTVVVCLITGLVVVNSFDWQLSAIDAEKIPASLKPALEQAQILHGSGIDFEKLTPEQRSALFLGGCWNRLKIRPDQTLAADLETGLTAAGALDNGVLQVGKVPPALREPLAAAPSWIPESLKGAALTKSAFSEIPVVGPLVLTVGLLTFVFSTILGWGYYGEKAAEYLFGARVILPYRWLWVAGVMVGSVASLSAVWAFADAANGLMAVPNLISLLALNGVLVAETKHYLWENRLEENPPS